MERTVQSLIVPPLSAEIMRAFEILPDVQKKDRIYAARAKRLRLKDQAYFGIEPQSPGRWYRKKQNVLRLLRFSHIFRRRSLAVFEMSSLDRTAVAVSFPQNEFK